MTAKALSPAPATVCRCGEPVHPCPHGPVPAGDPPRQMPMTWCEGWLHPTGSHRCHWPDGVYGPEGAGRPQNAVPGDVAC